MLVLILIKRTYHLVHTSGVTWDDRMLYCGVATWRVFFIGNVFTTKEYSIGQVKGCCYRWKSVGVIVEVGACGLWCRMWGKWYVYVV